MNNYFKENHYNNKVYKTSQLRKINVHHHILTNYKKTTGTQISNTIKKTREKVYKSETRVVSLAAK